MDEYKPNGNSNLEYLDKHNYKRLVLALLSINYLIDKFDALTQQVTGNVDILMLSEEILDRFPEKQFLIPDYGTPYTVDWNCHRGIIMLFVRENIPSICIVTFLWLTDLASLIEELTYYKSPEKPACIDLILTNKPHSFQNSCVVDGSFSHRMVVIVTKMTSRKLRPRVINYRDYKHFNNIRCRKEFLLGRNF